MVAGSFVTVRHVAESLSYTDAGEIARVALADGEAATVLIDLERTTRTTTAALARLVLLRRHLRKVGRDLRIIGPCGKAKHLYDISRLGNLLPQQRLVC